MGALKKLGNRSVHAYRGFVCVGGSKGHGQQLFTEVISRTPTFLSRTLQYIELRIVARVSGVLV